MADVEIKGLTQKLNFQKYAKFALHILNKKFNNLFKMAHMLNQEYLKWFNATISFIKQYIGKIY